MPTEPELRDSFRISVATAAWTILAGVAAVVLGIRDHTAVAVALGAVGFVDALGSIALAVHFRHALRHETFSRRREVLAHVAVSFGLMTVGLAGVVGGSFRLAASAHAEPSTAVLAVAGASLVVLTLLGRRKRALGARVGSRTLIADGNLSAIGALQAAVALVGVGVTEWFDAGSADAWATIAIGVLAVGVGAATWRAEPTVD